MVKSIFSLITSRQSSILSGAFIIMASMLLSKILGLIRVRLLFHYFSTNTTDIFLAANAIPDFLFSIMLLGALSVAFIPIFTEHLEKQGREEAFEMARVILNLMLLIFAILTVLIFIFADQITPFILFGFSQSKSLEVANLTRVILVGQFFLIVGSLFISMLQSFQRFIIPALTGVVYNLGIILGIIFLSKPLGIMGPAIGVLIGSIFHVAIQYPLIKSLGFKFKFPLKFTNPGVGEIVHLMGWRSIGLISEQINDKFGIILSTASVAGSLTALSIAQQLQIVPISLFGLTLAQAALPVLSSEKARGKLEEFKITFLTTMHQILFLTLPATAILIVIRIPVVRLVFGAAQFDWNATVLTGKTLAFLAISLSALSVNNLLVRGFYALKDTKSPVMVSFGVVVLNILLSYYFVLILHLEVWSIGFASSIAGLISAVLLFGVLHKKIGGFDLKSVYSPFFKMLMASVVMGMALYIPIKLLDQVIFDTTKTLNLILLTGLSSIFALSVYIILVWYLKVTELLTYAKLLKNIWTKLSHWPPDVKTEEIIHEPDSL